MIEIRNLNKSFGKLHVLKGINLTVAKGSVTAVLGPSGSGKSTLLRCINLLEHPHSGTLSLDGIDIDYNQISKKDVLKIRQKTAMVFQGFNLFLHKTVLENVTEGLIVVKKLQQAKANERAYEYLAKVGLLEKAKQYPSQLSGGQQQRVAIARALAMDPKVILFDEPTSALDPELVQEVLGVMCKVAQEGITMVIVTHEMNFARDVATDVVFMEDGYIIERSPAIEFFRNPQSDRATQFLRQITPEYSYSI